MVGIATSIDHWYAASWKNLYRLDPLDGGLTLIGPHDIRGLAGLGWSGRWLYGVSSQPGGDRSVYRINFNTGIGKRSYRLTRELYTAHSLAWLSENTVLVAHGQDEHTLHRLTLSQSRENRDLYLTPPDFRRIWTWDEDSPTYSEFQRPTQRSYRQVGTDTLRYQTRRSRLYETAAEQQLTNDTKHLSLIHI